MRMQSKSKSQFSGLNDKRFYFYDGIFSICLWSSSVWEVKKRKKKETHIHLHIEEKREGYLNAEAKAVRQCQRLQVIRCILLQAPFLYKLDSNLMCKSIKKLPTKNYVLSLH